MATKQITTRIKNKVAELSSWNSATGVLLDGEIAIVRVPTGDTYTNPVTGKSEPVVELLMKVGDGVHKFNEVDSKGNPYLPWLSAKASDVYNWAKAQDPSTITVSYNGKSSTLANVLKDLQTVQADIAELDGSLGDVKTLFSVDPATATTDGVVQGITYDSSTGKFSVTYGTVATSDLGSKVVTAAKIADKTITASQLADKTVTAAKIADDTITNDKISSVASTKVTVDSNNTTLATRLTAVDAAIAEKMDIHTHPYLADTTVYAKGASQNGAAVSANKVNKAVTFNTSNGAAAGTTFDGSAAVTVSYATIGAAAASHNHNDVYYTESEIDAKVLELNNAINGKAAGDHNHDDRYYTETEVDNKIAAAVSSALKYKGTKTTTAQLPTSGNATGDVWNITNACAADATKGLPKVNAGDNVAWNGTGWDVLAGTVDLSNYYVKSDVDAELAKKAASGHTHDVVIAKDTTSTNELTLAHGTKYKLTAGGQNFIFTMPSDTNTWRPVGTGAEDAAAGNHTHDDRYYTDTEVDSLLAGKQDTHDHPYLSNTTKYAGSATQGGAANSVANSIKVQLNGGTTEGTNQFTFNGSAAKTVNVTAGGVGAYTKAETDALLATKQASGSYAPSSHAHGNITTDGKITATAVTAASGVVVVDSSNKVQKVTDMSKVRSIIGAGTSSLTIGTTATTAAAGNHSHSAHEARTTAVESNYVRFANDKLYVGKDGADEIIFNCGGAPV